VKVLFPTAETIVAVNRYICEQGGNPHHCYDIGKIESAVTTAFYPGSYPFTHGGIAGIAGALCFYLAQSHAFMDGNKRTAALVAIAFMNQNGLDLQYPMDEARDINALAEIIENCADGQVGKDQLITWFESHKTKLPITH
jgi:death-on-curing protein